MMTANYADNHWLWIKIVAIGSKGKKLYAAKMSRGRQVTYCLLREPLLVSPVVA